MDSKVQGISQSFSFGSVAYLDDLNLLPEEADCRMVGTRGDMNERRTTAGPKDAVD